MSASTPEGVRPVVLGADVRVLADVLAALFERDRQLAVALNTAQRRLLAANERLTVAMAVGAVPSALLGLGGANLGVAGRRPPVLDAESPVEALGEVAQRIRWALGDYQHAAEQRREVAGARDRLDMSGKSGLSRAAH